MKAADNHASAQDLTFDPASLGQDMVLRSTAANPEPKGGDSHCGHTRSSR
jgi:hypothetical protein